MKRVRRQLVLRVTAVASGLVMALSSLAGDLFLMGDRVGYGITRAQGESCFAIAPSSLAPVGVSLIAMLPGAFRLPAQVVRSFDEGVAIVRIGDDDTTCENGIWLDGAGLETALGRTGIGSLEIRPGAGDVSHMHVRVDDIESEGFFTITPVRDSVRLMEGMSGSRVLLEDSAAGMLLSVDEEQNRGRVIRQDYLSKLVEPFFNSLMAPVLAAPVVPESPSADTALSVAELAESDPTGSELTAPVLPDAESTDINSMIVDSMTLDSIDTDSVDADPVNTVTKDVGATDAVQAKPRPEIMQQFFIGKQTWRNNPTIVGTRLFVGSSGRIWNEPDELDGVYSFDLDTGKQVWFVHTNDDFNDLTYIKGMVIGGTDSGEVLGIGARSGKTYWTRQFYGKVHARPAQLRVGVAIATSIGGLYVLNLDDGATKASSDLDAGVRAGLVAAQGDLWVATVSGMLYRYTGFGEVQMRRASQIYYPDEFGNKLSGIALDWYERLGKGRGQRAQFYGAPLVVDDRIVLSVVRDGQYEYPPFMAFTKNGGLDWIGTDPGGIVGSAFGDSRLTPASWYGRLMVADPYSNAIYSLSRDSGEVIWSTNLGHRSFQLWASPVVANDYVYVARHDGFLHKLQASNGKRIWSMYLGQQVYAGRTFLEDEPLPELDSGFEWNSQLSNPIYSTPAVSDDTIVVGTDEGYVYVIKDPD